MKKVILSLILCASAIINGNAQSCETNIDGSTFTVTLDGNVCELENASTSVPGYKFSNSAVNNVFTDQKGTTVAYNDNYYPNWTYYSRTPNYIQTDIPTVGKHSLTKDVYKKEGDNSYVIISTGSEVDSNSSYFDIDITSRALITDFTSYATTLTSPKFTNSGGWVYTTPGNNSSYVSNNTEYDDSKTYYIGTNQWNTSNTIPATKQQLIDGKYLITDQFNSDLSETPIYEFSDNKYIPIAGSSYVYPSKYYYIGISFAAISNGDIITDSYSRAWTAITPTYGNNWYRKTGDTYTLCKTNEEFSGDQNDYYTIVSYDYAKIALENMESKSYVNSTNVANSYWEALIYNINNSSCETVVVKSKNSNNKATICQHLPQTLMKLVKATELDMSDVCIEELIAPSWTSSGNVGTFMASNDPWNGKNKLIETLSIPIQTKTTNGQNILVAGVFNLFTNLHNLTLSDGITELAENCLNKDGGLGLTSLILPNTLKTIRKRAVYGNYGILTMAFPSTLELIETEAFGGVETRDVYFLGTRAPKVARHAWGIAQYMGNNGHQAEVTYGDIVVKRDDGVQCRGNYYSGAGYFTMLHYPTGISLEEEAKYTDVTRMYHVIKITDQSYTLTDKLGHTYTVDGWNATNAIQTYHIGQETTSLTGTTNSTSKAADKEFSRQFTSTTFSHGQYTGGFNDLTTGEQYQWPSNSMYYRSEVCAENGVTWNGTLTIAAAIAEAAKIDNSSSTKTAADYNSEDYEGLHQFVLTVQDQVPTDTKKWDMSKYADGKWHTICLPFNMTKKDMKDVFGMISDNTYDIRLCKFNKVTRVKSLDKNDVNNHITLYFNDEKYLGDDEQDDDAIVLEAHQSYMIKAKKENITNQATEFKGYILQSGSPIPTNVYATIDGETIDTDDYEYRFVGNYSNNYCIPQYTYFFSKKYARFRFEIGTTAKWNAYTSIVEAPKGVEDNELYFSSAKGTQDLAKLYTNLGFGSDENLTEVTNVTIVADNELVYTTETVYNLNGQIVSNSGLSNLPAGVYVVNGKKYLVK